MNRMIVRYPNFKRKALTLSYDDGVIQDKRLIEILDHYGLKGTFNLVGYKLSLSKDWPEYQYAPSVTREEAPAVYRNHEVAVHGYQHALLSELPAGQAVWQIIRDREELEQLFGRIIRGMAYPMGGTQNETLISAIRSCGMLYARATGSSHSFTIPKDWLRLQGTCHSKEEGILELAEAFIQMDDPYFSKLFYMWGHSYEFDDDDGWSKIEAFCKLVSGRTDIWFATNGSIFEYLDATNRLVSSADGKLLHNPSAETVYLEDFFSGRQYALASGDTLVIP